MSTQIANIDLSAATVGTQGDIIWGELIPPPTLAEQMRPDTRSASTLVVFNESGCLIKLSMNVSGQSLTLPAGRWVQLPVPSVDDRIHYSIQAIALGAPFSILLADMYYPGEQLDPLGILGNSPIGVSGNVSTSGSGGTTFIKNDGNVPATSIIESTPSDQGSSSVSINNDASGFMQVLSANVLRKILNVVRGNATTTKAAISFGDSGDTSITTFYGTLGSGSVVPSSTITGSVPSTQQVDGTNAQSTTTPQILSNVAGAGISVKNVNAGITEIVPTQPSLTAETLQVDYIDSGGTVHAGPHLRTDNNSFNSPGQWEHPTNDNYPLGSTFSGSGSGTYTHNFKAKTPDYVGVTCSQSNSTMTVGADSIGTTTAHVNCGAAFTFSAVAMLC